MVDRQTGDLIFANKNDLHICLYSLRVIRSVGATRDQARGENDHAAESFLKQFLDGQHAETTQCRFALEPIELVGNGPEALYLIDRELTALGARKDAATAA